MYVHGGEGAAPHSVTTARGADIRFAPAAQCAKEATATLSVSVAVDPARAERTVSLASVPCGAKVTIMRVMASGTGSFAVLVGIENGPRRALLPPMTPVVVPPKEMSFMDHIRSSPANGHSSADMSCFNVSFGSPPREYCRCLGVPDQAKPDTSWGT